ncbi:MAG: sigma-70 family RNA polymerase sigma factor [Gemmatimonadales bacterium]
MSPIEGERYRNGPAAEATPVPEVWGGAPDEAGLVRQFRERLRLFALRRLRDSAAAEDVAQETLRRVVEACRAGRLNNPSALPSFLFQTAHHICLQHFRSSSREGRAFQRLGSEDAQTHDANPLTTLIGDEQRDAVREALKRLSPEDRDLLRMMYYEEVDSATLARRLSVTAGALRVRKHRVLARLAALLNSREI